jgi:hypothetical protein
MIDDEREAIELLTRTARELGPMSAPGDFTSRVLARVALEPRKVAAPRLAPIPFAVDPLPWWVRSLAQPASALAFLVLGLAFWLRAPLGRAPQTLGPIAEGALAAIAPWAARVVAPFAQVFDVPGGAIALAFAAVPLVALVAWASYAAALSLARSHGAAAIAIARRAGT